MEPDATPSRKLIARTTPPESGAVDELDYALQGHWKFAAPVVLGSVMPAQGPVGTAFVMATVIALAMALLLNTSGVGGSWMSDGMWLLTVVFGAAILTFVLRRWYGGKRVAASETLPMSHVALYTYRLTVICDRRQAATIEALRAADREGAGEPVVFRVPMATPRNPALAILTGIVMAIAAIAGYQALSSYNVLHGSCCAWIGAIFVGVLLPFAFLWPTYLRISPGKLDVMRFGVLGGKARTTTYYLSRSIVFIHTEKGELLLSEPALGVKPFPVKMRLGWLAERPDFIAALIDAATTDLPERELPSDSLVG